MVYPVTVKIFLPIFDVTTIFQIPSDDDVRVKQLVSLIDMTCDCSEFMAKRSMFDRNDLQRACKHIRRAIVESDIMEDSWLRKLIGDRFIHEHYYVSEEKDCAFAYSHGNPWIQYYGKSYTTKKGTKVYYDRFSYSVTEQRWSSNKEPMNISEVVAMIREYFPVTNEQRNWKPSWPAGTTKVIKHEIDLQKKQKGDNMSTEETANVTESLHGISEGIGGLIPAFMDRTTSLQSILELFLKIMESEQTYHNFWNNKDFRKKIKGDVQSYLELSREHDSNFASRLEMIQRQSNLLVQLITMANQEGMKII